MREELALTLLGAMLGSLMVVFLMVLKGGVSF